MITDHGLNPNQLYVLYCIKESRDCRHVNPHLELRLLRQMNFLNEEYKLTTKAYDVLYASEKMVRKTAPSIKANIRVTEEDIVKYLELWPPIKLPSGKYARSDKKNLERNFKWFFSTYPYTFDTVFKATAQYILEYESKNYMFMRTSEYFIRKYDVDKNVVSELANYCSVVESGYIGSQPVSNFSDKVV
jgi:hypothetical protein